VVLNEKAKIVAALLLIVGTAAAAELAMGRRVWGTGGLPGLWSGDILSEHNSQFLLDPYSFTHITHGVLLYALVTLVLRHSPVTTRLLWAIGLESAWEVLENTSFIIDRYRAETISLNYYGDSVVNSVGDIAACIVGFLLASRLPRRATVATAVTLEVLLAVWTRDNLTLNIIMLIHPIEAIRTWQAAVG
jgi:hypothetical protein